MNPEYEMTHDEAVFWVGLSITIYCMPIVIAIMRKHRNTATICIVDMFLGWTFIGWVVALAWSLSNER